MRRLLALLAALPAEFFLVTSENRLGENGTRGFRFDGSERTGSICP